VKILAPLAVIKELAESFPTIAWEEAGLTTQTIKNRIFVQRSARAELGNYLDSTPRNSLTELPANDIQDGSERVDPFDHDNERIWPGEDGANILGTSLGSSLFFISSYLQGKGLKLQFIKDVVATSFPREAE
jgi:hypothetical protein